METRSISSLADGGIFGPDTRDFELRHGGHSNQKVHGGGAGGGSPAAASSKQPRMVAASDVEVGGALKNANVGAHTLSKYEGGGTLVTLKDAKGPFNLGGGHYASSQGLTKAKNGLTDAGFMLGSNNKLMMNNQVVVLGKLPGGGTGYTSTIS